MNIGAEPQGHTDLGGEDWDGLARYEASFGLSVGLTSLFNGILVVLKETNEETVLAWMKAATGHHWVTHGMLDLVMFAALGFVLAKYVDRWQHRPNVVAAVAVGGVLLGGLIIAGFFI